MNIAFQGNKPFKQCAPARTVCSAQPSGAVPVQPAAAIEPGILIPMLAGAQARGMADMLEMLGRGAILIDRNGHVLYASDRARDLLDGIISLTGGHPERANQSGARRSGGSVDGVRCRAGGI